MRVAVMRTCTFAPSGENFSAFSIRFASTRWICVGVDVDERRLAGHLDTVPRAEQVDRLVDEIVERPDLGRRRRAAGLEAGEVEQVADEPAQPLRVDVDRLEQLVPVFGAELQRRVPERADGRPDPRQRRAQVVRHRAEQRRLDEVAPAQRLGLERLLLQPVALDGDGEQRGERGQEAMPRRDVRIGALRHVDRADRPVGRLERMRRGSGRRPARRAELDRRLRRRRAPAPHGSPTWSELVARARARRSSSVASSASSADSRSRCSADAARRRARAASSLTTTAVAR